MEEIEKLKRHLETRFAEKGLSGALFECGLRESPRSNRRTLYIEVDCEIDESTQFVLYGVAKYLRDIEEKVGGVNIFLKRA